MRTLLLLSFCIFYINHKIPAQSDSLDSLNTEINQNLNAGNPRMLQRLLHTGLKITDSLDMLERNIKYRYFLGASYFGIDLDSGLAILKSAYEEAGKLENPINKMLIASQLATFYRESGNYSASLRYLQICIEILDQQEDGDQKRRALSNFYLQQAKLYRTIGDYEKALDIYLKSLKKIDKNDSIALATRYLDIGSVNIEIGDNKEAVRIFNDVFEIASEQNHTSLQAEALAKTAEIKYMAGLADSAYAYWRRSIAIKEKADLNSNQTKLSLASAYLQRDNIKMAKSVIQSIDTTSFPLNSLEVKNEYLLINARIFRLDNSFEEAYEYSEQALKLAERSGNLDYLSSSLLELSKLYEISGKSSLSLSAYKRFYAARDSLLNIDRIEAVEKLKARYESDIQREEIRELEQQAVLVKVESQRENAIWFATVVVLILLLIVILFWYQRRVAQQKTKALHTNLKFLQSQLNPHFVYNSLTSLQRFVIENKSEDATIYISKFSRLMRQFLEHSREDYISIHEEMNAIKNYLLLQKIRYKEKFDYSVKLDNSPQREAYIPPMFAQPFVENAIEHGFKRSINNGEIEIVYEIKEDECIVTITDNGSGYQEKSRDNNHKSLATIITKERMDSLEKIYHKKITLDVTSSDSGTKVTLALPLKQSV